MTEKDRLEKLALSVTRLTEQASKLNQKSDELGQVVDQLDGTLKNLGLGIAAWTKIDGDFDAENGYWWEESIGYDKIGTKWGIAIRESAGHHSDPEDDSVDRWLFNDAPRTLRIKALEKLPELVEALVEEAERTTKKVETQVENATLLADVIGKAVNTTKSSKRK